MAVPAEEMQKQLQKQQGEQAQSTSQPPIKPAGIVNTVAAPTAPVADQYKAPEVKPITTEVDAGQETVEDRLNKLTASDSKYIDLAKSDAMRSANTRGLINSSIAAGAGTEAAIRQALPIAQQDAKTYTDTRFANQAAQNEFLRNRQSANLNIETAAAQSQLTNEENTLLNDLTMKRDEGLSDLTQEEQAQLNDLEMKRDAQSHTFDIARDAHSAELNESLAAFESELRMTEMELDSELKLGFETALNDVKFSDEMKLQIVSTMNNIIRDFNQQVTDIGMSDRTAEQQATAIDMIKKNRDAELAVYQDLLAGFNDWNWGTDFTPESTTSLAQDNNYWNAPGGAQPINEPKIGDKIGGEIYEGNGIWKPTFSGFDNE